ncbi:unnamed protein product [Ectocarpus sp. CCAP 1310/34]|nr:unnamed protein product [Ectocarpus sp. CCAP 1310/34]
MRRVLAVAQVLILSQGTRSFNLPFPPARSPGTSTSTTTSGQAVNPARSRNGQERQHQQRCSSALRQDDQPANDNEQRTSDGGSGGGVTRREFFNTIGSAGAAAAAWAAVAGSSSAAAGGVDRKAAGQASRARVYGEVDKSPNDPRSYRAISLASGMKVLLISDPNTKTSAAAMDVHVGHFSDPDDLPGLAHFCEHLLFLGTDNYSTYLGSHGGTSNAYTDTEDTVYFFDVSSDYLKGALDRFAQFFIAPQAALGD